MKSYLYDREKRKVSFGGFPRVERSIASLEFVNAIYQSRLLDYHLDYLTVDDLKIVGARDNHNDINYRVDECNKLVELLKQSRNTIAPNLWLAACAPVGQQSYPGVAPPGDSSGGKPGSFATSSYYSDNVADFPDKLVNDDPTSYGNKKEEQFLKNTTLLNDHFGKYKLDVVEVTGGGALENFCNLGIAVFPRPDFAVVDQANGKVVGFIEHKTRTGGPTEYNNIFDPDVMQASMYSILPVNNAVRGNNDFLRVWIVQNYSDTKYVVTELEQAVVLKTLSGISSQYHRLANDVKNLNVVSPEGIAFAQLGNTVEHDYWRKILLCHIVGKIQNASTYIHKGLNAVPENNPQKKEDTSSFRKDPEGTWSVGAGGWLLKGGARITNPGIPLIAIGKIVDPAKENYINKTTRETMTRDFGSMDDGPPEDDWVKYYPPDPVDATPGSSDYGTPEYEARKARENVVTFATQKIYKDLGLDAPDIDRKPCDLARTVPTTGNSFRFGEYSAHPAPPGTQAMAPYILDDSYNRWSKDRDLHWLPYYVKYKESGVRVSFSKWKSGYRGPTLGPVAWERRHDGSSKVEGGRQFAWSTHHWNLQRLWDERK